MTGIDYISLLKRGLTGVIEVLMEFSLVPSILIILVVAEEHMFFNSKKGRQSIFIPIHSTKSTGNARNEN
jgi:hypothetical protein